MAMPKKTQAAFTLRRVRPVREPICFERPARAQPCCRERGRPSNHRLSFTMTATSPSTSAVGTSVPAVGQQAPDFTLPSTSGEKVTLSALRGKPALIAFFPLAFSSTCTAELCEMRDHHDQFADRGVTVLPISVDHTYSLEEYKAKHHMSVDLLSDFMREVSRRYGVLLEERGYANRAYFLLDDNGVIRWEHVEANASERRQDAEIFAAIDALKR
jgi:peroxiredoxin